MRSRGVVLLGLAVTFALAAGVLAAMVTPGRDERGPDRLARAYFAAWRKGSLDRMRDLVADPPADFHAQHRALSRGLSVMWIDLRPDRVVRNGDGRAQAGFTVARGIAGHGEWSFRSLLKMGRVDGRWRVLWSPSTLYPGMRVGGTWRLRAVEVPAVTLSDRRGGKLPEGGPLEPYLTGLADSLAPEDDDEDGDDGTPGWAIAMSDGGGPERDLKLFNVRKGRKVRTTLDRRVQAAAEAAVAAAPDPAAIVALRPSTGEVLAVADGLGGLGAFANLYPPGSTFKTVVASALIADGMDAGDGADCPARVVAAQRTIVNHDGTSAGRTTLRDAFAQSCNTTFAGLAVDRLGPGKLGDAARGLGFGVRFGPGVEAATGSFPDPGKGNELAEAAIGQGRVQASPLLMASVAAAVQDGTWRSPRLLAPKPLREAGGSVASPRDVPGAAALRTMMRAVVTSGTASGAGLPDGTAGKTGTAELGQGGGSHAWFVGYEGDMAFSVFVSEGGSGPKVAVPLAARFLRAAR